MSTNPAGAAPPVLRTRPPRRWPWLVAALAVAGALLALAVHRPFPTDEERKYIGWWRGLQFVDENGARAWVADFRPNGEVRVQFRSYHRAHPTAAWIVRSAMEFGTWRVYDGVQELKTDDLDRPVGLWERYNRIEQTGHWRRVHCYRTIRIDEREMTYSEVFGGETFHALRSRGPVELPDTPLPPGQWGSK